MVDFSEHSHLRVEATISISAGPSTYAGLYLTRSDVDGSPAWVATYRGMTIGSYPSRRDAIVAVFTACGWGLPPRWLLD